MAIPAAITAIGSLKAAYATIAGVIAHFAGGAGAAAAETAAAGAAAGEGAGLFASLAGSVTLAGVATAAAVGAAAAFIGVAIGAGISLVTWKREGDSWSDAYTRWAANVHEKLPGLAGDVVATIGLVWLGFATIGQYVYDSFAGAISGLQNFVAQIPAALSAVGATVGASLAGVAATVSGVWSGMQAAASSAWAAISGAVSRAVSALGAAITSGIAAAGAAMSAGWSAIQAAASAAWSAITSAISSALSGMVSAVSAALGQMVSEFWNAVNSIIAAAQQLWASLVGGSIWTDMLAAMESQTQRSLSRISGMFEGTFAGLPPLSVASAGLATAPRGPSAAWAPSNMAFTIPITTNVQVDGETVARTVEQRLIRQRQIAAIYR